MSKTIARILDQPESKVAARIAELEAKTGYPSADVRLLAESSQLIRQKITSLGLDPDDTTSAELYHALAARYNADSLALERSLGVDPSADYEIKFKKTVQLLSQAGAIGDAWALKNATAKKLLMAQPPIKLMKQLHYRTVESFIKRESIAEAYLVAAHLESPAWQQKLAKAIAKLQSTDFLMTPVKVVYLSPKKYAFGQNVESPLATSSATGSIGLWPNQDLIKANVLSLALLLLEGLNDLNSGKQQFNYSQLHPSLAWWADSHSLIYASDDQPVSMHINDVAANKLQAKKHGDHYFNHAANHFWQTLLDEYDHVAEELASDTLAAAIPTYSSQTAPEYAEADG